MATLLTDDIRKDLMKWDTDRRLFPTAKEKADEHGITERTVKNFVANQIRKKVDDDILQRARGELNRRGLRTMKHRLNSSENEAS